MITREIQIKLIQAPAPAILPSEKKQGTNYLPKNLNVFLCLKQVAALVYL